MTKPSRAFTLVELAIVIAVIPLVGLALYTMIHHFSASGDNFTAVMNAEETGLRLRAAWRADVLAARSVEVKKSTAPEMILRQSALGGGETCVIYCLTPGRCLERKLDPQSSIPHSALSIPHSTVLARGIRELSFDRIGSGWRMNWTLEDNDGLRRRTWRQSALATPLTPDPEVTP